MIVSCCYNSVVLFSDCVDKQTASILFLQYEMDYGMI